MTTETPTRVGGPRRSVTLPRWAPQALLTAAVTLAGLLELAGNQQIVDLLIGDRQWLRHVVGVLEKAVTGELLNAARAAWTALELAALTIGAAVANLLIGTSPAMPVLMLVTAGALVYLCRT